MDNDKAEQIIKEIHKCSSNLALEARRMEQWDDIPMRKRLERVRTSANVTVDKLLDLIEDAWYELGYDADREK